MGKPYVLTSLYRGLGMGEKNEGIKYQLVVTE